MPRATFEGELCLPHVVPLQVANLENGKRVMISRAFLEALGRPWKGTYQRTKRPNFIDAANLDAFITPEVTKYLEPIDYISDRGTKNSGYAAELLPLVCGVYLRARDKGGVLTSKQVAVANQADVVMRGLATYGLFKLIDRATGFEQAQARDELQQVLAAYISPELLPWTPRFPDVFYEHLHKVRNWPYQPGNNARNGYIGKLTKSLIYDPLPRGVREELERKNPYVPSIRGRKHRHHQLLTESVGHPHLEKQITAVTTLLKISDDWDEFLMHFSKAFPLNDGLFKLSPPPVEASS